MRRSVFFFCIRLANVGMTSKNNALKNKKIKKHAHKLSLCTQHL